MAKNKVIAYVIPFKNQKWQVIENVQNYDLLKFLYKINEGS